MLACVGFHVGKRDHCNIVASVGFNFRKKKAAFPFSLLLLVARRGFGSIQI